MPSGRNGGGVKAVVDTNVLVSGLLWPGNPSQLLDAIIPIIDAAEALKRLGLL